MPRKHKRRDDARSYGYSTEAMDKAVVDVRDNGLSIKKTAFLYGLIRSTLINHIKNHHASKVGRPTVLKKKVRVKRTFAECLTPRARY